MAHECSTLRDVSGMPQVTAIECSSLRDLSYATAIIAEILGCREGDTYEIFRLCAVHGRGVIEMAKVHIDANPDVKWSFATFIEGVFITVLNEIKDSIDAAQFETLRDIQLDDEPDAWFAKGGGIAERGDAFVNEAEIFADMCRYGVNFDRIEALKESGEVISEVVSKSGEVISEEFEDGSVKEAGQVIE